MIKVSIYNEYYHERRKEEIAAIYPQGIHNALKENLEKADSEISIRTFTLDTIHDLTEDVLNDTDVLIWWGHAKHPDVPDEVAVNVKNAVLKGMGAIFLHSAHFSKPFTMLMGTSCDLGWRVDGSHEYLWVCNPAHPITQGLERYIYLEHEEVYCEPFAVPEPDELLFVGNYEHGEAFRSGCCYRRGYGKIFYFQPGHEAYPTFYQPDIIKVICNAIRWAKPMGRTLDLWSYKAPRLDEEAN